jgi:hypothetical protein
MRRFLLALILTTGAMFLPTPATAQAPEAAVRAAIDSLFAAVRSGNGVAAAALFHPDAVLSSIAEQDGQPILRTEPAEGFVQAVGAPRTQVWDERISGLEIRIDGRLATAWMDYAFFIDDTFSHCGVNAIQLFHGTAGWRIIQITDTRRREDCLQTD